MGNPRLTIDDMHATAASRGGRCLSRRYINSTTKLLWGCEDGHRWYAAPAAVRHKSWCRICAIARSASARRLSIGHMDSLAKQRGIQCVSRRYVNSSTKMRWRCGQGHTWQATPGDVRSGHGCPHCYDQRRGASTRHSIELMQQVAAKRKGKCLSSEYLGTSVKLEWCCKSGHKWSAAPASILAGHWCPQCAGVGRKSIDDMRRLAERRGGKCLSDIYVNLKTKLDWQCAAGHRWRSVSHNVRNGAWCPVCAGNAPGTLEQMKAIASSRGGQCLAKAYLNSMARIPWRCAVGHRWLAAPASVKAGSWCRRCANARNGRLYSARFRHDVEACAKGRGGEFVGPYRGAGTPTTWRCSAGHTFQKRPSDAKKGSWCPDCAAYLGERVARAILEQMFQAKFPKARPEWLRPARGPRPLELDGLNSRIKVAFEYQGEQHVSVDGRFTRSAEALRRRRSRDRWKAFQCSRRDIVLLAIPGLADLGKLPDHVRQIVTRSMLRSNRPLPIGIHRKRFDLRAAYRVDGLSKLREHAASRGGRVLAEGYLGASAMYEFECSLGHRWKTTAASMLHQESWCRSCSGKARLSIQDMRLMAAERGGRCLSRRYVNKDTKLRWECAKGHRWRSTGGHVRNSKAWCPRCAHARVGGARRSAPKATGHLC